MLMNEGLHLLAAWLKRGATFSYSHSVSYEWSSTVQQRKVHSQISWLQSYWRCAEQDKSLLPVYTRVDWWLINSQISVSLFKEKSARMVIVNGDMVIYGDIRWYMVIYGDITFFFDLAVCFPHAWLRHHLMLCRQPGHWLWMERGFLATCISACSESQRSARNSFRKVKSRHIFRDDSPDCILYSATLMRYRKECALVTKATTRLWCPSLGRLRQ